MHKSIQNLYIYVLNIENTSWFLSQLFVSHASWQIWTVVRQIFEKKRQIRSRFNKTQLHDTAVWVIVRLRGNKAVVCRRPWRHKLVSSLSLLNWLNNICKWCVVNPSEYASHAYSVLSNRCSSLLRLRFHDDLIQLN